MIRMSFCRVVLLVGGLWSLLVVLWSLYRFRLGPKGEVGHWMGFSGREARLAERLRETEELNQWLKLQLKLSQAQISQQMRQKAAAQQEAGQERELSASPCEMVEVAIVCAGVEASRTVVTLIKSILFYRQNPVTFHFVSDLEGRRILTLLTSTWHLPQVTFRFYQTETVIPDVDWIPNKHYSGVFGLLKLTLPKILPPTLDKVIILDTDVTFATDIGQLWAVFSQFTPGQALGLVENQSDWYIPGKLWKNHRPWPALGRGLNTGVILMDLAKLRREDWHHLWRTVAETDLVTQLSTSLADQDVFNAVLRRQEGLLHPLACRWNVQLSDNSLSDQLCYDKPGHQGGVSVVHFNSPKKLESVNKHVNFFRNLHLTFLQYDGNLLRRDLYNCPRTRDETAQFKEDDWGVSQEESSIDSSCHSFKQAGQIVFRSHIFFLPHCPSNQTSRVTLVAQLSLDRLHMVEQILAHWDGPVSLALYLSDPESQVFLKLHQSSSIMRTRCDVAYHVVYKEGDFYPVNYLRNLALDQVTSEFVFLSDIDFLPSFGAQQSVQTSVRNLLEQHSKRVLVVPAFESQRYKMSGENKFPETKAELVKRLDLGQMFTFRQHDWPAGHQPTNFAKWRLATTAYQVRWKDHFEPYVVGRTKQIPRYDTRFVGFGWNKVSHMMALHAEGYELVVLPDVFIVHQPHAPSQELLRYRTKSDYRACLDRLKEKFVAELEAKTSIKFQLGG